MYRKKYLIGIYTPVNQGETLVALLDNALQFSQYVNTSLQSAKQTLSNIFNKKYEGIILYGKIYNVQFINMEEE